MFTENTKDGKKSVDLIGEVFCTKSEQLTLSLWIST